MPARPIPSDPMAWYAIRTVYLFGQKPDGTNVFEERIVAFDAASWDEANAKGDAESTAYADANGFEAHPEQAGYELEAGTPVDGGEVWSELYEARLSLADFHRRRYAEYAFVPDPEA
jgi:hypothetical protein